MIVVAWVEGKLGAMDVADEETADIGRRWERFGACTLFFDGGGVFSLNCLSEKTLNSRNASCVLYLEPSAQTAVVAIAWFLELLKENFHTPVEERNPSRVMHR